jgi:mannitol-1-phosphate/altronate dehydrogenase
MPGLTVVPCELRENNADLLQQIVLQLATDWHLPESTRTWIRDESVIGSTR